jgi:hypothetical protein
MAQVVHEASLQSGRWLQWAALVSGQSLGTGGVIVATSGDPEARMRADAAVKLSLCALELVHNVTLKLGGDLDLAEAARGLLDNEAVDTLDREQFMREKAAREFAAQMLVELSADLRGNGVSPYRPSGASLP